MKALLKVEWIKTWRTWPMFIMAVGMPVGFFLIYSGMKMYDTTQGQTDFIRSFMITMTAFSMSSFGIFSFPYMLKEDQTNHWLSYLEHSRISIYKYYLSKIFRVLLNFLVSIIVTFMIGAFVRHVEMTPIRWIGTSLLLLMASLVFLALGLLIERIKSEQIMSIVGNIAFLGLAILGCSWMPITMFPDWVQSISKVSPIYHVNQLAVNFAQKGQLTWNSLFMTLAYAIIVAGLALFIKQKQEVESV